MDTKAAENGAGFMAENANEPYGPAIEPPPEPEPTPGDLLVQAAIRRGPTNFAALDRADEARTRALQARERGEASLKAEEQPGAEEQFALERAHQSRANYWFKKAYKLNTNAGVKQLVRGGTAREVKAKYEAQRAALDGAFRTAERAAREKALKETCEEAEADRVEARLTGAGVLDGFECIIEIQIETLPEVKRSVLNRRKMNGLVGRADPLDLVLGLV